MGFEHEPAGFHSVNGSVNCDRLTVHQPSVFHLVAVSNFVSCTDKTTFWNINKI